MEKVLLGLTTNDVRHLAYEIAEKMGVNHPFSHEATAAGMTGCAFFFKRNDLSIRVAQGTNIARATGFNRFKVDEFFYAYRSLIEELIPTCLCCCH